MFEILPAHKTGPDAIETLLDDAFGPDRLNKTSYRFRDGVNDIPTLRFVARADNQLAGTIRFWPVTIGRGMPASAPALLLGPLGVSSKFQNMGIGAALMIHGMNAARDQRHDLVLLVGELDYYGRFGFAQAQSRGITMPGEQDHRLLVRELRNGALGGVEGFVTSLAATSVPAA